MDTLKIYIASPLGFSEAGRVFYYDTLVPMLKMAGFTVIDPWKLTDEAMLQKVIKMPYGHDKRVAWRLLNYVIGENNATGIDECDVILAILDGADVDSGTASEIGYGFAKGKRIIGYRGDFRLSADNEGGTVNLQVEYFIKKSGGDIADSLVTAFKLLKEYDAYKS